MVFGAVVGGSNVDERKRCAQEIAKRNVSGIVFNLMLFLHYPIGICMRSWKINMQYAIGSPSFGGFLFNVAFSVLT